MEDVVTTGLLFMCESVYYVCCLLRWSLVQESNIESANTSPLTIICGLLSVPRVADDNVHVRWRST